MADCVGVTRQTCLRVANQRGGPLSLWYSGIEGFEFEAGYDYERRVRRVRVALPPADASSIRLILEQIVSTTPAGDASVTPLEHTSWTLVEVDGATARGMHPAELLFADGRVGGSGGCNRISGSYTLEGDRIATGPLISTRMACPEPAMAQEATVLRVLQATPAYRITATTLELSADGSTLRYEAGPS